jgi:signal transduction histidine kinase
VDRLRLLIDNLLDVTGIETGRLRFADQPFDLVACVNEAIAAGEDRRAEKQQRLVTSMVEGEFPAAGDAGRVTRAIEQMLENANKFCPRSTAIGLLTRRIDDDVYEVLVADQGAGIPEGFSSRVFDPFFQIDGSPTRAQGGTGVGLAVARGVARGHGGDLTLVSPCSETIGDETFTGSCFRLTIHKNPRADFGSS